MNTRLQNHRGQLDALAFALETAQRSSTLSNRAHKAIRVAILRGDLERDRLYSENFVAERLGMSRTPAREALQKLDAEGLIEIVPQKGFLVRSMSEAECVESYKLRDILESYAVETLSRNVSPPKLAALHHLLERQEAGIGDPVAFIDLDHQFHVSIAELADLPRTARLISQVRGTVWSLGVQFTDRKRQAIVMDEHWEVVRGLDNGDRAAAVAAMRTHIRNTFHLAIVWTAALNKPRARQ